MWIRDAERNQSNVQIDETCIQMLCDQLGTHSLPLNSAVGDAYAAPVLHMQRQAYFLGAAYAAPRKIKFPTELQKNRFFNFNLEKK